VATQAVIIAMTKGRQLGSLPFVALKSHRWGNASVLGLFGRILRASCFAARHALRFANPARSMPIRNGFRPNSRLARKEVERSRLEHSTTFVKFTFEYCSTWGVDSSYGRRPL